MTSFRPLTGIVILNQEDMEAYNRKVQSFRPLTGIVILNRQYTIDDKGNPICFSVPLRGL